MHRFESRRSLPFHPPILSTTSWTFTGEGPGLRYLAQLRPVSGVYEAGEVATGSHRAMTRGLSLLAT
jgi:hypothetical protein